MFKSKSIRFIIGVLILFSIRQMVFNSASSDGSEDLNFVGKKISSQRSTSSQRHVAGELKKG